YTVVVSNAAGTVTSSAATITVDATLAAPTIATQPSSISVNAGTAATFKAAASGASIAYQWYRNSIAIAGANAASYTIPVATAADAGSYTVSAQNTAGVVTSSAATLTVNVLAAGANTAAV